MSVWTLCFLWWYLHEYFSTRRIPVQPPSSSCWNKGTKSYRYFFACDCFNCMSSILKQFLLMSCFSFGPQLDADSPFSDSLEYIVTWCRLQYVQSCGRQLHPCDPHYSSLPIIYALYPFKGWIFKSQSHFVFILSLQQVQTYFQYM